MTPSDATRYAKIKKNAFDESYYDTKRRHTLRKNFKDTFDESYPD